MADYHRFCPKCDSVKKTDDGECIYCPTCITMYEGKHGVRQAQAEELRQKQRRQEFDDYFWFILTSIFACVFAWFLILLLSRPAHPHQFLLKIPA